MKNVLLLGGGGFIGTNLAMALVQEGASVYIYDRQEADYERFNGVIDEEHLIRGSFSEIDKIKQLLKNIDIVVHLISSIIPETTQEGILSEINGNIANTLKLLFAMKEEGVNKIVFVSSGGTVYGNSQNINSESDATNPINSYGWAKLSTEHLIRMFSYQYCMNYLILRPSNPFGPWQNINGRQGLIAVSLGKILFNKDIEIWGDGSVVRDYIYIEDMCQIILRLIKSDSWNEIFNIGAGIGYSINQILDVLRKVTDKDFRVKYFAPRSVDSKTNILCIDKLKQRLYSVSFTDFESSLKRTWDWNVNRISK